MLQGFLAFDRFDRLRQTRLGAGGLIGVNHVFGSCLIQALLSNVERLLASFNVSGADRCADRLDEAAYGRLRTAIAETADFVLTETLLGTS